MASRVSTGYGATDDGMGVVSVLQLISHFTTPGHQPKHGIVAMLNNGEEDYLWGARAFEKSPVMPFVHTFLNLEGAGAGGRAVLFRSTDMEVTRAYAKSSNPFGTVIGSDSFSMGFIKSQTDYIILDGIYGARGLDLAFYEPRSMYHTMRDDARHTSRASLWHMLSASVETMKFLSGDEGDRFTGPRLDGHDKVPSGSRTDGVWFDIWGKAFALMGLRTLFGWTLALLVGSPLILMLVTYALVRQDKYYFFSRNVKLHDSEGGAESVSIDGLRGLFRYLIAIVVASGFVAGSALLLKKVNPFIIYSSSYAV
ncbi:M28 family peptidase [Candidatus Bathyarchaeota archaeon]|nr:M28 family peptidase [Candidatus Bathyarchaeota archaeon]